MKPMILKQITMKCLLLISIVILLVSCKSNAQEQQCLDEFANELSAEAFNKMIQSCPIDFEQSNASLYTYQGYYDIFKNAGICRLFEIKGSTYFQKKNNDIQKAEKQKCNLYRFKLCVSLSG